MSARPLCDDFIVCAFKFKEFCTLECQFAGISLEKETINAIRDAKLGLLVIGELKGDVISDAVAPKFFSFDLKRGRVDAFANDFNILRQARHFAIFFP